MLASTWTSAACAAAGAPHSSRPKTSARRVIGLREGRREGIESRGPVAADDMCRRIAAVPGAPLSLKSPKPVRQRALQVRDRAIPAKELRRGEELARERYEAGGGGLGDGGARGLAG